MMREWFVFALAALVQQPARTPAAVTVTETAGIVRPAETVVLTAAQLKDALAVDDLRTIHVKDEKISTDLLTQAIDTNDDGTFDELLFQADLAANETRRFTLSVGERRIARRDEYRAYGRFVRERRDDFAWENDLVAHRMYGAALETWAQEPLTSSGLDVWVKRTPRLVINDWYMVDDYHRDTGEGADLYSVGKTRGCGGSGLWLDGKLHVANNFRNTRVLANGPLRVMFELLYEPYAAGSAMVREKRVISLDAGHRFNRIEVTYQDAPAGAANAAGIRNNPGSSSRAVAEAGTLRSWEPLKGGGNLGCAVIVPSLKDTREADGNYLAIAAAGSNVYYAGSAWDRGGDITTTAEWDAHLAREAARIRTPVEVRVTR